MEQGENRWPKAGVVYNYTDLLAIESGWSLHELFPLFWHCYRASQSNVRQYITCDLRDVDPGYVGRAADWLTRHHDSFDDEGRKLFEWLQDLHPDLSKELEAVINSDCKEDRQNSADSAGEGALQASASQGHVHPEPPRKPSAPMSKKQAVVFIGGEMTLKKLTASMKMGATRYTKFTRQTYIFCREQFPQIPSC